VASRAQEVRVRRIVACFVPGRVDALQATALANEMQAEFLGLFIEDAELLRFAALPFAAEVGFASAVSRALDPAAMERALHVQAFRLRQYLAAAFEPGVPWSLRIARASPAEAVAAALAEGWAPSLLIPPGGNVRAEPSVIRQADASEPRLRALLAARRPVLILSP
jgi:hypothetical protein